MSTSDRRPSSVPADLRARVLAEVARVPAPTRREHRTKVAIVTAAGVAATLASFFLTSGIAMGTRPVELVAVTAGAGLLAALVLGRISGGASGSMLGRPRQVLLLACALVAVALGIVACVTGVAWPEHAAEPVPSGAHVACGALSILQGALPLIALLVPRRGSDPVHPAMTGAALGMTAGAWSSMMAYLRCPHAAVLHCLVAHVVPMVVLAAAGALLGRALLKIR